MSITDQLSQHDFELLVVAALRERHKLKATYEHPGFVCVPMSDGSCWNIGTANDQWSGDRSSASGVELGLLNTDIASTTRDLCRLVSRIVECISANTPSEVTAIKIEGEL